jgi:hypothetical protein
MADMATGGVLSESWARAAQARADLSTTGAAAEPKEVCFTGVVWVSAIASCSSRVQLSPGEYEALLTVLSPLPRTRRYAVQSTSFGRTDALRTGPLDGLPACLR